MIKAAVLGSPISHSLSPNLHNLVYSELGIKAEYEALEVGQSQLRQFLASTDRNCLSLTMPLKEEVLKIADSVSDISARIASGNTLTLNEGRWNLTSTDVAGFEYSLNTKGINQIDSALIIGAGATARASVSAISKFTKKIYVINRNPARESLMNNTCESAIEYLPWHQSELFNHVDLVVNTTPVGAADYFLPSIEDPKGLLFEVLYNPWPTHLSSTWSETNSQVIDGLDLLIHQAISQIEIFTQAIIDRSYFYGRMRSEGLRLLS